MSIVQSSTLRPGLLVSLKTSVTGNVSYTKTDIERSYIAKDGSQRAKWETERKIADPEEHERAEKARSKAHHLVRGVCAASAFGLLCPEGDADELDKAVAQARAVAEEFNSTAKLTRISVFVIAGRIAPDDVEAVKAINSELKDLLEEMENGIQNCDAKAVRAAASKAKSVGVMLSPDMQARIQIAVDVARSSATRIVKAGEEAAQEIDRTTIRKIREQRTAFLDMSDANEVAAPKPQARAVEFEPTVPVKAPKVRKQQIEME